MTQTGTGLASAGARRGSWPEARNRRLGPEIDVVDALEKAFCRQRVECFGSAAFIERPEAAGLRQRHRNPRVILELAADSGE